MSSSSFNIEKKTEKDKGRKRKKEDIDVEDTEDESSDFFNSSFTPDSEDEYPVQLFIQTRWTCHTCMKRTTKPMKHCCYVDSFYGTYSDGKEPELYRYSEEVSYCDKKCQEKDRASHKPYCRHRKTLRKNQPRQRHVKIQKITWNK